MLLDPCTILQILKRFLKNFDICLEYNSVSYTMVCTPCFEEVYLHIRNQSDCFCETSFGKAELSCAKYQYGHKAGITLLKKSTRFFKTI